MCFIDLIYAALDIFISTCSNISGEEQKKERCFHSYITLFHYYWFGEINRYEIQGVERFFLCISILPFYFYFFSSPTGEYKRENTKKEKNLQVVPLNGFCCVWNLHKLFHLYKPVKAALISALWIIRGHNSLNGMKKLKAQVFSSFCPMSQWPIIFLFLFTTNNDKFSFQFFFVWTFSFSLSFVWLHVLTFLFIHVYYTCMCLILNNLLGLEYLWTIQKRRKEDLRQQKKKRRWRRTEKENVFLRGDENYLSECFEC